MSTSLSNAMQELSLHASAALVRMLESIPVMEIKSISDKRNSGHDIDMLIQLKAAGRAHALICVVKPNGQPRHIRYAIMQLQLAWKAYGAGASPMVIAPYLAPAARAMCRDSGVAYLDFAGNTWLAFGGIFIEREVENKPQADRRELRSLFSPKSAQVLRVMLRRPDRRWRVTELAEATGVSLGHISNVRSALLDREWAKVADDGVALAEPDALLDAWQHAYQAQAGERQLFYTPLHGKALEDAARRVLSASVSGGRAMFSSFSAAHWLSPYARTGVQYFYADQDGLQKLIVGLKLSPVYIGENIVIALPKDDSVLLDTVEPVPGVVCTSVLQTYLDLSISGERGKEAAMHLRQKLLAWSA